MSSDETSLEHLEELPTWPDPPEVALEELDFEVSSSRRLAAARLVSLAEDEELLAVDEELLAEHKELLVVDSDPALIELELPEDDAWPRPPLVAARAGLAAAAVSPETLERRCISSASAFRADSFISASSIFSAASCITSKLSEQSRSTVGPAAVGTMTSMS